ncbi:MAG TPA: GNAT family N-acetyltransferase [Herpetosiphonaceae bacterium]|nr:GNAT family N-acetyltransferase [Herpetosiphonaceae bacterium]
MSSPITLRPATPADMGAVAALLVQLYAAEIPGALTGPPPAQRALLRYTLEAENHAGLRGRYVAEAGSGALVGSAGVRLPGAPPVQRAPAGTIRMAYTLLGYANATRMVGTLARSMLAHAPALPAGHAYVHGVVVDERQRGRGLGLAIMQRVEDELRQAGVAGVQLQVVIDNAGASRLYERLGYRVVGRSPRWLDRLTFPTNTMAKEL